MYIFYWLIKREIQIAIRYGTDTLGAVLFFILTAALFPLALGPTPKLLWQIAPGILWVCILLAALLPLDRLFNNDYEDGSLDQILLLGLSTYAIALTKIIGHWLTTGFPLLVASLPLFLMFNLPYKILPVFLFCLTIGTVSLSLLGGMTACIALGARRTPLLLPILTLPLLIPILIFGTLTIDATLNQTNFWPYLKLSSAYFIGALSLCPIIAAAGINLAKN